MSASVRLPNGRTVDLDKVSNLTDADKVKLLRAVMQRRTAADADPHETSSHLTLEKIRAILGKDVSA